MDFEIWKFSFYLHQGLNDGAGTIVGAQKINLKIEILLLVLTFKSVGNV